MVLLVGEENKNREQYLGLEKEYEFTVLFGVSTDSYDYLGFLKDDNYNVTPTDLEEKIRTFIASHVGKLTLKYPPFSSKTINGVPMYKLAKENKLADSDLPKREVSLDEFAFLSLEKKSSDELREEVLGNLEKIRGFFRQEETSAKWVGLFNKYSNEEFLLGKFRIKCTSGTYVRTLAHMMGKEFGCGAIAYEILRTKVGEYQLADSLVLKSSQ